MRRPPAPIPRAYAATALICPSYVTNNKILVGDSDYKSNILAEYQLPALSTGFFTFDWHHVGRRPADDMNSYYVPQYNTFDLGGRYSAKVFGKLTTWLLTFNNVIECSLLVDSGPGQHHRTELCRPRTPGRAALDHGYHAVRILGLWPDRISTNQGCPS